MKITIILTKKLLTNYQKYMFYEKHKRSTVLIPSWYYLYSHPYKKALSVPNSYRNQEITLKYKYIIHILYMYGK